MGDVTILSGREVIAALAARFPQLYVAPSKDAREAHRAATARGIIAAGANLSHFIGSVDDELREVQTPAGPVEVLFLKERADFETILQIISHRSDPTPIAPTIGAITYRGLADWGKVASAHDSYLSQGGTDWPAEFSRLAHEPGAFRSELVIVSEGPYSNVRADKTSYEAYEWIRISREIRLHHECAHVVCRRLMPNDVLPVWDEVTADVVGLLCACGNYDAALASRFLGVTKEGFVGGRLREYLDEGQLTAIDGVSREVYATTARIANLVCARDAARDPFAFLLELKRAPLILY